MVNSSLYHKLFGGNKHMRQTNGFHHFNLNLVGGQRNNSFFNLLNQKKQFLIAVFANLIIQLGISYYFMMNFKMFDDKNKYIFLGLFIFQFILILILAFVPMPYFIKFILFSLFSVCSGVMLSFLKKQVDPNIIQTAVLGAISVFGLMFLFGALLIMFGIKLGFQFASFLFFALLCLIIFQIVFLFSGKSSTSTKAFSIVGLIIFSLYVIYDTNNILQREYYGDFITASLDYYLDIINIFIDLVSINNN